MKEGIFYMILSRDIFYFGWDGFFLIDSLQL